MTQISDVAGGTNVSILDVIRRTMDASSHLDLLDGQYRPVNWKEAFYLATLGGAEGKGQNKATSEYSLVFESTSINLLNHVFSIKSR